MADPHQVMRIIRWVRGVDVHLEEGQLIGRMKHGGAVPDDMIRFIRHYKPLIVTYLKCEQDRRGIAA